MTSPIHQALKELGAKRSEIGAAIISLAKVAGVDPAPYLGVESGHAEVTIDPPKIQVYAPKQDTPPRPQRPASPRTNGAGQDDKVILALKHGPLAPEQIRAKTGLHEMVVRRACKRLVAAKQLEKLGTGPRNTKYQLSAT